MITEEIMELLNRMIDLTEGTAYAQGINMVIDALGEYDEDKWNEMSLDQKDKFLSKVIRKNLPIGREIREEIEDVLRKMTVGRNYREWSEETIECIYPYIEHIIIEDDNEDRVAVDEDMVVTAMMMALCGE